MIEVTFAGHEHSKRLCLRSPVSADLAEIERIHTDPATNQFNPSGPSSAQHSRTMLYSWIDHWQKGVGYWCVREVDSGPVIGVAGVRRIKESDVFNLYYRFAPEAWGHGFATEVASLAVSKIVGTVGTSVVALIRPGNEASMSVAERAGLVLVGEINGATGLQLQYMLRL